MDFVRGLQGNLPWLSSADKPAIDQLSLELFDSATDLSTATMAKTKGDRQSKTPSRASHEADSPTSSSSQDLPDFDVSHDKLIRMSESMVTLQNALVNHPQFNKDAPQNSPQLLFFVMDFLVRTMRDYVMKLEPEKVNAGDKAATEVYTDVLSRNGLLALIITDKTGKSKMFGKEMEKDFKFGEDIEAKAQQMMNVSFGRAPDDDGKTSDAGDAPMGDSNVQAS